MGRRKEYNWSGLKIEFLKGKWLNVSSFLKDKGIPVGGSSIYETKGWREEKKVLSKKVLEIATGEILEENVNDEKQVRTRQAGISRHMQLKGMEALRTMAPANIEEARKLIQTGLIQERDALGISESKKGGATNLTQVNVNLPKTKLDQLIDGLNAEGILKLIAELRRQRELRAGAVSNSQSKGEIIK